MMRVLLLLVCACAEVAPPTPQPVVARPGPPAGGGWSIQLQSMLTAMPEHHRLEPAVPADPEMLTLGETLYIARCLVCHGRKGLGNGPGAFLMVPRPANLALHNRDGVPTDGERLVMVREGVPGTPMPPFEGHMTPEEMRAVVAWTRSL